jgi:hypothetical protein
MQQRLKFCDFRLNIFGISTCLTLRRANTNRLLSATHNYLLFRSIHMFWSFTTIIGPTPQLQFLGIKVLFNNFILQFNILTSLLYILTNPTIILEPSAIVDHIYFQFHVPVNVVNLGSTF